MPDKSLAHIRAAFDPLAPRADPADLQEETRSGRIYVTGSTAHAACPSRGLGAPPPASGRSKRHASVPTSSANADAVHSPSARPPNTTTWPRSSAAVWPVRCDGDASDTARQDVTTAAMQVSLSQPRGGCVAIVGRGSPGARDSASGRLIQAAMLPRLA